MLTLRVTDSAKLNVGGGICDVDLPSETEGLLVVVAVVNEDEVVCWTVALRDTLNVSEDAAEAVIEYEMVCVSSSGQTIQGSPRDRG